MCEADYLFIREWPQKLNWPENLCQHVLMVRTRCPRPKQFFFVYTSSGSVYGRVTSDSRITTVRVFV